MSNLHLTKSERLLTLEMANARTIKQQMAARVDALRSMPGFEKMVARIDACNSRNRCGQEDCYRCAAPEASSLEQGPTDAEFLEPPLPFEIAKPNRKRNFRKRGGQHLDAVFGHFDPDQVYALTMHLAMVPIDADVRAELTRAKDRLKKQLTRAFGKRCVLRGFVEDKVRLVGEAKDQGLFRRNTWAAGLRDDDFVVNLHLQASVHIDGMGPDEIKHAFKSLGYDGSRQVHVQPHRPAIPKRGEHSGGITGWGEYSSKRLVELTFGERNLEAFREIRRYRNQLQGKVRLFGHNVNQFVRRGPTYLCETPLSVDEFCQEMEEDISRWA